MKLSKEVCGHCGREVHRWLVFCGAGTGAGWKEVRSGVGCLKEGAIGYEWPGEDEVPFRSEVILGVENRLAFCPYRLEHLVSSSGRQG